MAVVPVAAVVVMVAPFVMTAPVVPHVEVSAVAPVHVMAVRLWDVLVRHKRGGRNVEGRALVSPVWRRAVAVYCVRLTLYLRKPSYCVVFPVRLLVVVLRTKVVV